MEFNWFDEHCGFFFDFKGFNFDNATEYLPKEITTSENEKGTFMNGKYRGFGEVVQFLYNINDYYVLFQAIWSEEKKTYKLSSGKEIYYGIPYLLTAESIGTIIAGLESFRNKLLQEAENTEDMDVINTTHFSAILNCDAYERDKTLTEQEGMNRMFINAGIEPPCRCGDWYYLMGTYHIEPNKVPYYVPPVSSTPLFAPMPYPYNVKPKKLKKPSPCCKKEDLDRE